MNNKIQRRIRLSLKVAGIALATFIVLVLVAAAILYKSKDKVTTIVVTELNRSLKSEIKVSKIDFAFFWTFPFASLQFKDVLGKEVYNPSGVKDTLFYAEDIYLKFNLWDLYHGIYDVKQIRVKNAGFYMKYFQDSIPNYNFWKTPDKDSSAVDFRLSLNKTELNNVHYIYHNEVTHQRYDVIINKGVAKGDFSSSNQTIRLKSNMHVNCLQTDNVVFLRDVPLETDISFHHDGKREMLIFEKSELQLRELPFFASGNICYASGKSTIDLSIQSQNIRLESLLKYLPAEAKNVFKDYKSKGTLDLNLLIKGKISSTYLPSITAQFGIANGSLSGKNLPVSFRNINLKGSFSNGEKRHTTTYKLVLNHFSTEINRGYFKGHLSVENFKQPRIDAEVDTKLDLADLHALLKSPDIETLSGLLTAKVRLEGEISDLKRKQAYALNKVKMSGNARIDKANFKWTGFQHGVKNLSSNILFDNKNTSIQNLVCSISSSNIRMNGTVDNLLSYLFLENQPLSFTGNLDVDKFKGDEFFASKTTEKDSKAPEFSLPKNITAKLSCNVKDLSYRSIKTQNVSFQTRLTPGFLWVDNLKMSALGGSLFGSLAMQDLGKSCFRFSGNFNTQKVNLKELFFTFDNFGQKTLKTENLQGMVSGDVHFSTNYCLSSGIDKNSLEVSSNLSIENGALTNFGPLKKLSRFIDEQTLENVKFSTLNTSFYIKDQTFKISQTDIKSNAANLGIFGWQKFSGEIDYHLKLKLSDFLSKKQKARLQKEQAEFGSFEEETPNDITLYIWITGTIDNPVFKYDKKNATVQLKENLKKEKENVKNILIEEFSTKDAATKKEQENWKKQEAGNYVIEWEEKKDTTPAALPKTKKQSNLKIEWDD